MPARSAQHEGAAGERLATAPASATPAGWGGARPGAGRKRRAPRALVPHRRRQAFLARFPAHVTLRVLPHVWNLRSARSFRVLRRALSQGAEAFGARVVEFSIQGNHLHLLLEAPHRRALSRAMQGLGVRIARGLNRLMARRGKVLADRYHVHVLCSLGETRNALRYVRENHARHSARMGRRPLPGADPFSSAAAGHGVALATSRTYLVWRARIAEGLPPLVGAPPGDATGPPRVGAR